MNERPAAPTGCPTGGPVAAHRRARLEHAAACRSCRERLAEQDPAALFALLGLEPLPAAVLDRVSREAARAIGPPRAAEARWARFARAASLAAALLLGASFGRYVLELEPRDGRPAVRAERGAAPVPGIELLATRGQAEVVDLVVGEHRVVMIFDRELDL